MLFNDYPFLLVFLPAALLIFRLADPYPQARIPVLVLLSLCFYAYGNPPYVLLLIASITINWCAAFAFGRFKLRAIPLAAIVLNLLILGFFKYTNFVAFNLGWLAGGVYHYEGRADATNFFSTYTSKYDHGTFQMTRP